MRTWRHRRKRAGTTSYSPRLRRDRLNHEIELYSNCERAVDRLGASARAGAGRGDLHVLRQLLGVKPAKPDRNVEQQLWRQRLPNGTTLSASDSTGNGNNGTLRGRTVPAATTGEIDGAASFNGSTANIQTPLNINTLPITVSAWVYPTNTSGPSAPWSTDNGGWDYGIEVNGGTWQVHVGNNLVNTGVSRKSQYLGEHRINLYGQRHRFLPERISSLALWFGPWISSVRPPTSTSGNRYILATEWEPGVPAGTIDEVESSNVALSAGWIATGPWLKLALDLYQSRRAAEQRRKAIPSRSR